MSSLILPHTFDQIVFRPQDIDLSYSPLRRSISEETFVLGAFNPGMTRLPNGNILLMVRVAEALKTPIRSNKVRSIRWEPKNGYTLDAYDMKDVDASDPRKFLLKKYKNERVYALTSISWLLPVELSKTDLQVVKVHYGKAISSSSVNQEYGIEDARISRVEGTYVMTVCSVSSLRHCTSLYTSTNGIEYDHKGIILDHQNKDMLIFEGTINHTYYALTRPLGKSLLAPTPGSGRLAGPSINLARSPDLLHWRPLDEPFIYLSDMGGPNQKLGGGTPPILTDDGWLLLFHGVEDKGEIGKYDTYWALLDTNDPSKILHIDMIHPLLQSNPKLTNGLAESIYLSDVVFTTGILDNHDQYIVASGELDLCCRIDVLPKSQFLLNNKS